MPHARGVLSGKLLEQLRKAILLPDERVKLAEMVEARELCCMSCGRTLHTREMVSYVGTGLFICHNCDVPVMVACSKCREGAVMLPDKLYKAYQRARTCEICAGTAKPNQEAVPQTPPPLVVNEFIRFTMPPPPSDVERNNPSGTIFEYDAATAHPDPIYILGSRYLGRQGRQRGGQNTQPERDEGER